jgi:hypothetical protein
MSPKTHSKGGRKSCYRRRPISARGSNRKGAVTRRTCFLLLGGSNINGSKGLAKVTAVTFRPTTERASALLRGSEVTCYFPRGYFCYFLSLGCGATVYNRRQRDRLVARHFRRLQTTCQPSMLLSPTGVTFTARTSCLSSTLCAAPEQASSPACRRQPGYGARHGRRRAGRHGALRPRRRRPSMSGCRSRDEGSRTERAIVRLLQAQGIAATKISGMYKPGADSVEVKCCATGFDATAFTSKWGAQTQAIGWTARELFGLHTPPERPHPTYSRLGRLDHTGLIWLLRGRPVVALTETTATIAASGATLTFRRTRGAHGPADECAREARGRLKTGRTENESS